MEKAFIAGQQTFFPPPNNGLSLSWRLALSTVLIIVIVMGGISVTQQLLELEKERQMHQKLLEISLPPLAVRLEAAMDLETMQREVDEFHAAYTKKGYAVHEVVLIDADKEPVLSTEVSADDGIDYLQATIPIYSPLLEGGKGSLIVLKSSEEYRVAVRRDWLLWFVHFTVTLGVVFLFLAVAIYFQVTKPVNRLVSGVKKMEKGYWKPIELTGGAREIRWLAWRFGNMVQEVQSAMTHLFEAEQKARSPIPQNWVSPPTTEMEQLYGSGIKVSAQTDSPTYRKLLAICERLETATPEDSEAVQISRSVWQHDVLEANRLGFHQLKARLENAALSLMQPDEYTILDDRLSELKESLEGWADHCHTTLYHLLEEGGIPCAGVLHRVKHTAGVWAKMQSKGLSLDEVHDLFAFRIIVPTEGDCYAALGLIHQHYKPVVSRFKDYIARPKGNNYRSLHTCVSAEDRPVFEVQIRSVAMDRQAERGDASHWLYKKDKRKTDREPVVTRWWRSPWWRNEESPGP